MCQYTVWSEGRYTLFDSDEDEESKVSSSGNNKCFYTFYQIIENFDLLVVSQRNQGITTHEDPSSGDQECTKCVIHIYRHISDRTKVVH